MTEHVKNALQLIEKFSEEERIELFSNLLKNDEFLEALEDLHDSKIIAEREDDPTNTLDEVLEELAKDGVVRG